MMFNERIIIFIVATLLFEMLPTTAESILGDGSMKWLPRGLGVKNHREEDPPSDSSDEAALPSLFGPEETKYERFAACLAASGMSVSDFSRIGKQISHDPKLKDKVMEQAYLYRMAAQFNREPALDEPAELLPEQARNRILVFCESMAEIERLREDQMDRLKKSLHVEEIPPSLKISDSSLKPFLSPKVRAVVEAFPLQAEAIVKRNGLDSNDFNQMLEETQTNPAFRGLVESYMRRHGINEIPEGPRTTTKSK